MKHSVLVNIIEGKQDWADEEDFCYSEKGELLMIRLKVLCEYRCEYTAVKFVAAFIRTLQRSDRLQAVLDPHDVTLMFT